MHEYILTPYSLYAAVSVGLETEDIISVLDRLSKVPASRTTLRQYNCIIVFLNNALVQVKLPESIKDFIRSCTRSYGKVKLLLQRNRYFVESAYPEVFAKLLDDAVISASRAKSQVRYLNYRFMLCVVRVDGEGEKGCV